MKTKQLLIISAAITAIFFTQQAKAKIWRVNNNGYSADFAQLQDANDANNVVNGDTVHIEASATIYSSADISKRLIIIGPGYFLLNNTNVSANPFSARVQSINFRPGSSGSQAMGIFFTGSSLSTNIYTSTIVIKRCRFDVGIYVSSNISNIEIVQNFFSGNNEISTSSTGFPTDMIFNNNICLGTIIINDNNYILQQCNNNVFNAPTISPALQLNAGTFYNNIFNNPNATVLINGGDYTNVDYNISASANNQFGNSKHNIIVSDTSRLFLGGISPDGRFQLKANSPAIGIGSDGTDIGAFGGAGVTNHYTLSGLAPIPVIYNIATSGVGTPAGLNITIQARTIK